MAVIRLGIVVALGVVALADSHGRRRLLTAAAILAVATTALGAFSPGLWFLGGTQLVARGLTMGMGILIGVFAAEELPRGSLAYGVRVLALCAAPGAGTAVCVLPLTVLDPGVGGSSHWCHCWPSRPWPSAFCQCREGQLGERPLGCELRGPKIVPEI